MRRLLLAVAAVAGGALAGACSDSGYTYVANRDEQVFFKVPDEWSLFDESDILVATDDLSDREAEQLRRRVWLRGFTADGDRDEVFAAGADEPRGFARVLQLTAAERDSIDPVLLRTSGFPDDPATGQPIDPRAAAQDPSSPIEVLQLDETLVLADGVHGARVTARVTEAEEPYVFSQTTLVDARTTRLYTFTVGCKQACWDANEEQLMEIVESWTLEERA